MTDFIVWQQTMPGGVRTYLLNVPVKPAFAQHKAFDLLLVSIVDGDDYDWQTSKKRRGVKANARQHEVG